MKRSRWQAPVLSWMLTLQALMIAGCSGSKLPPPTLSVRPSAPLSVHPSEAPTRVYSSEEEIPTTFSTFDGARGSVRLTLEIEGTSNTTRPAPISINDVSFKAVGEGRISMAIKRPSPAHPNGLVTVCCCSGNEESSAVFEPELWFHKPGAIVTYETVAGEGASVVGEGKEIILGRYVARNVPQDIRVTLKAMFTKDPMPARTVAGIKPAR